jgi:hypothetical protein
LARAQLRGHNQGAGHDQEWQPEADGQHAGNGWIGVGIAENEAR